MADLEQQVNEKVAHPPTIESATAPGLAAYYNQWMAQASAALVAVLDAGVTTRQLDAIAMAFDIEVDDD